MAYDFIDSVGNDVDVVSDSENIKKLLKIPYSKSHVSMAVHRIGRTLLLDELDIQELFMRSSQVTTSCKNHLEKHSLNMKVWFCFKEMPESG